MKIRKEYPQELFGLLDMAVASFLFAAMAGCVYAVSRGPSPLEAPVVSFIRVGVNLGVVFIPALLSGQVGMLLGDLRPSLWLRGLFGGTSLMLSFISIQRIGPGESAFLTATSGIFVAAMGPWILGQRNRWGDWAAILGAFAGLYLLMAPQEGDRDLVGRLMGVGSGFLAALAYLMVSRAGRSNPPVTIVFYFSLIGFLIHGFWFSVVGLKLPEDGKAWSLALGAGLLGTIAQYFLTRAYQRAPAAKVSAMGFLSPVLSLGVSVAFFAVQPSERALWGCFLILVAGVFLPFVRLLSPSDDSLVKIAKSVSSQSWKVERHNRESRRSGRR
jgi:drug/metabolite transporter (DMT)-like permease